MQQRLIFLVLFWYFHNVTLQTREGEQGFSNEINHLKLYYMETIIFSVILDVLFVLAVVFLLIKFRNDFREEIKKLEWEYDLNQMKANEEKELKSGHAPNPPKVDKIEELKEENFWLRYELDLHKCTIDRLREIDNKARYIQLLVENKVEPEKIVSLAADMYNFVTRQATKPPAPTDKIEESWA